MGRSVKVTIAGQTFSVKTSAKPAYIKELAAFVTERMEEVKASSKIGTTQSIAMLTALSIADDLFELRESDRRLRRDITDKSKRILKYLDKEARL